MKFNKTNNSWITMCSIFSLFWLGKCISKSALIKPKQKSHMINHDTTSLCQSFQTIQIILTTLTSMGFAGAMFNVLKYVFIYFINSYCHINNANFAHMIVFGASTDKFVLKSWLPIFHGEVECRSGNTTLSRMQIGTR